jgi:hypothetical protein
MYVGCQVLWDVPYSMRPCRKSPHLTCLTRACRVLWMVRTKTPGLAPRRGQALGCLGETVRGNCWACVAGEGPVTETRVSVTTTCSPNVSEPVRLTPARQQHATETCTAHVPCALPRLPQKLDVLWRRGGPSSSGQTPWTHRPPPSAGHFLSAHREGLPCLHGVTLLLNSYGVTFR